LRNASPTRGARRIDMSWAQIQGHDRWVRVFRDVVERQRLAHAYLFVGPDGIGKRLFAIELAKALLCERTETGKLEACGACEACVLVEARTHPDFFLVEKPSETATEKLWTISLTPIRDPEKRSEDVKSDQLPIHVMRELCRLIGNKSARGHGRVAIVVDADQFNDPSANCFLKTLEEPPPKSLFILLSTSLDNQLPTIRSRCQVIRFAPLTADVVGRVLGKQGVDDPQLLGRLVKLAAGSPGQALALNEPALWQFRAKLLHGLAQPKVDSVSLAKAFAEFAEDAGKEAVQQRRRAGLVLKLLLEALAEVLAVQAAGSAASVAADDRAVLEALARRAPPGKILALLERCLEAELHLDRYIQVSLVVEALIDALGRMLEA
jgi:DNA polymerase-3 subunit delta'